MISFEHRPEENIDIGADKKAAVLSHALSSLPNQNFIKKYHTYSNIAMNRGRMQQF